VLKEHVASAKSDAEKRVAELFLTANQKQDVDLLMAAHELGLTELKAKTCVVRYGLALPRAVFTQVGPNAWRRVQESSNSTLVRELWSSDGVLWN